MCMCTLYLSPTWLIAQSYRVCLAMAFRSRSSHQESKERHDYQWMFHEMNVHLIVLCYGSCIALCVVTEITSDQHMPTKDLCPAENKY